MDAPRALHFAQLGSLAVAAALAAVLARFGTPIAVAAARATGFLDKPTGALKAHAEATPYLGGMAVFVPFLTAAALVFELDAAFLGVLLAATLAALLGLMDDFGAMRPGVKLVGQIVIVIVLLRADVRIGIEAIPPAANVALTAAWMLGVMNAVNFLDIMDGLAATTCTVASAFFVVVALMTGEGAMASLSAALLGALLGYLPFSLPKARIFLGDSGSLFLGATLGALALALDYSSANPLAVFAPVLILGLPCFEIAFTVLVRVARRRPPWRGSPDHVALRLRRLGLSVAQVDMTFAAGGLGLGAVGVWLIAADPKIGAIATAAVGVAAIAAAVVLARAPDPPPR